MAVNLSKGQKVSLSKQAEGRELKTLSFGLGWKGKSRGLFGLGTPKSVDLDASCVVVRGGQVVEAIWFGQLHGYEGKIRHSGDDRTGRHGTNTDNEIITIDANNIRTGDVLVFTVNSYTGEKFSELASAYIRVTDDATKQELARFNLQDFGHHTGLFVGALQIKVGDYEFQAIEKVVEGRTVRDLYRPILRTVYGV